jgi:hypothetical protein
MVMNIVQHSFFGNVTLWEGGGYRTGAWRGEMLAHAEKMSGVRDSNLRPRLEGYWLIHKKERETGFETTHQLIRWMGDFCPEEQETTSNPASSLQKLISMRLSEKSYK